MPLPACPPTRKLPIQADRQITAPFSHIFNPLAHFYHPHHSILGHSSSLAVCQGTASHLPYGMSGVSINCKRKRPPVTSASVAYLQGDDYILYCHPNRQKTPRSDRLREWYHTLLRQAKNEGIVTYLSNLYDTFFEGGKDHRVEKPSVLHLPYFEGAPCFSLIIPIQRCRGLRPHGTNTPHLMLLIQGKKDPSEHSALD